MKPPETLNKMQRRDVLRLMAGASVLPGLAEAAEKSFSIRYVLSSALYGDMKLETILPEVARSGAVGLDLWGKPHGTQREELDALGTEAFAAMLEAHGTRLTVSTRYPLGCFGLQPEMPVLRDLGGEILVCGTTGPSEPEGEEAKQAVLAFLEKIKPHADAAGEHGLKIAVENHSRQFLYHPDALRYFAEYNDHPALGVSFAPHQLHGHIGEIPGLIRDLGNEQIPFIYFQEYGIGSKEQVAKEIELEQLPGRGTLDYGPIVRALRDIGFTGYAEIFMHPTPRGVPMLDTAEAITAEINASRAYLKRCLEQTS